jgi:hypothetical protein
MPHTPEELGRMDASARARAVSDMSTDELVEFAMSYSYALVDPWPAIIVVLGCRLATLAPPGHRKLEEVLTP